MKKSIIALVTMGALTSGIPVAIADHHAGAKGYALVADGQKLAVMPDLAKPTKLKTYALSQKLKAIAYRPVTGELIGISDSAVVVIDPSSGKISDTDAKFVGDAGFGPGAMVGFDFNNKIDAVRAVSSAGDNLVYFPVGFGNKSDKANSVRRVTKLAYAEGDPNAGKTPMIFANAYTNAINGQKASGTFQFAIDAATDSLVSLANNAGTLKTIGAITIDGKRADLSGMGGFDIVSPAEGKDQAYAILQLEGQSNAGLYVVDLKTAEARLIADLGLGGISGFAVSKT